MLVVVEHRDGGDASRRAARTSAGAGGRTYGRLLLLLLLLLADVGAGAVRLHVEERALAGAVVGRVAARHDHPVPAEPVEVDDERVAAAASLRALVVAVELGRALGTRRLLRAAHDQLQVRLLQRQRRPRAAVISRFTLNQTFL